MKGYFLRIEIVFIVTFCIKISILKNHDSSKFLPCPQKGHNTEPPDQIFTKLIRICKNKLHGNKTKLVWAIYLDKKFYSTIVDSYTYSKAQVQSEMLPPTQAALYFKIKRSHLWTRFDVMQKKLCHSLLILKNLNGRWRIMYMKPC